MIFFFFLQHKLYRRKRYISAMKKLEKPILFLRKFKIYLKCQNLINNLSLAGHLGNFFFFFLRNPGKLCKEFTKVCKSR